MKNHNSIRPMPLWMSAAFFGTVSLIIALGIYVITPYGNRLGIAPLYTYVGTLFIASLIGIILSLRLYFFEKKQGLLQNVTFRERFWIEKFSWKDLLWGIGLLLFWALTLTIIKGLTQGWLKAPSYLISAPGTLYGVPIKGNFGLIVFEAVFLFINIAGEELFWRGYMLPRQELAHGRRAWMVNGALWALFHSPIYWMAPALAPGCIALAFVTQKRRSIWPAMIAHLLLNGTDMILTLTA